MYPLICGAHAFRFFFLVMYVCVSERKRESVSSLSLLVRCKLCSLFAYYTVFFPFLCRPLHVCCTQSPQTYSEPAKEPDSSFELPTPPIVMIIIPSAQSTEVLSVKVGSHLVMPQRRKGSRVHRVNFSANSPPPFSKCHYQPPGVDLIEVRG